MKNRITLLIILASLTCQVEAQNSSAKSILGATVDSYNYEYVDHSVEVKFRLDLSKLSLDSKESVVFTPVISSSDDVTSLPTVVVRGRSGAKSYQRAMVLGGAREKEMYGSLYKTPYKVVDFYGGESQDVVEYSYSIPYERWMLESRVDINGELYSCCNSDNAGVISCDELYVDISDIEEYNFEPQIQLIKPEKVAIKRRDINHSTHIIFKVNSSAIDPDLRDNKRELDMIDDIMQSILSDDDYTITSINLVGYASPEGYSAANQVLSENRALAIEQLLLEKYDFDRSMYKIDFGGENWTDLIPLVERSSMENKSEILDIIRNVSIENGREKMLMNLNGGADYRYMLSHFFPSLRKVDIDVDFNVDAYDLERIKEVIKEKPQNLSLEEMYRLSESYEVHNDEFLDIFTTAVEFFPDDRVALHNAMVNELNVGNVELAAPFAKKLSQVEQVSSETANALGVYYTLVGDYDIAAKYLQQAIDMGNSGAPYNMENMNLRRDTEVKIEQRNELKRKVYGNPDSEN